MWQGTWDPEGILSTFPSFATTITGMLVGHLIHAKFTQQEKAGFLMSAGLITAAAGYFWGLGFPVNENLWTSSFVLVTSGFASLVLGAMIWWVDIFQYQKYGTFGVILGANAIAVYVFGDLLSLIFYRLPFNGKPLNIVAVNQLISWSVPANLASLMYALFYVGVVFIPAWLLYRKNIIIKI